MANVSDWSANEKENTHLDELTLSGEGGLYTNKIMCAVKKKFDNVDGKLASVQGAYVFKGTKADMAALEAVEDPAVGDVYSVTALGGENYAWDGTAWDDLGTSDANVVHKTSDETIAGAKTFTTPFKISTDYGYNEDISENKTIFIPIVDKNGVELCNLQLINYTGGTRNFRVAVYQKGTTTGSKNFTFGVNNSGIPSFTSVDTHPASDNEYSLGSASKQWKDAFVASGTISTSDERLKTSIADIDEDILDAWGDVKWKVFQYKDAVAKKGESARIHAGVIAQQIDEAFSAHELDATRYGLFCHDAWGAETVENEDGAMQERPAGDRYTMRYAEAFAVEAAYQRRRADRLESRIAALEARLGID